MLNSTILYAETATKLLRIASHVPACLAATSNDRGGTDAQSELTGTK